MVEVYTAQSFKFSLYVVMQRWFLTYCCNLLPSKDEDIMLFGVWLTMFQRPCHIWGIHSLAFHCTGQTAIPVQSTSPFGICAGQSGSV